jgi:hypothetical protein
MTQAALNLKVGPQVLGPVRIQRREGRFGAGVIAKKYIPVQVLAVWNRGPFERDKGGELAWVVMLVGIFLLCLSGRLLQTPVIKPGRRCSLRDGSHEYPESSIQVL